MSGFWRKRLWDMEWTVAIRPHREGDDFCRPMQFQPLKNTWRYWCADPFPFDYKGKTYIFMEVADILTQKGAIGYRMIDKGKVGPICICLKTPHHMSYPMLFTCGNDIFMIPECHESKTLTIYRAKAFPDKWEPVETVLRDKMVCDTNYLLWEGKEYLLTMPLRGNPYCYDALELYCRGEDGTWALCENSPFVLGEEKARNAGHFFMLDGQLMRPSQNCGASYGENIVLNRVLALNDAEYREEVWQELAVTDVETGNTKYDGIHTFNSSPSYDAIDLRVAEKFQPAKLLYFLRCKLKRGK